ncbi:uncharacterized protein LOC116339055 [Contarinia nasturtii]|uniref:uncharacterized protein LOC116339055 n=1 Tax=Contarinia nasturtii TaxID=265458 RepID=UPI0012D4863F|nr:uncharacterized protein LOC116339055 [Contarinia nasturtii]
MRRFCYLLCIFLVFFDAIKSDDDVDEIDEIDQLPQIALVDQLTKDYLVAERKLWEVIERREDSTLQQIYNVHTEFLNRNYGETNVFLNGFYANNVDPKLLNCIITINETSHDIAREFFEHRNYTVLSMKAFEGIHLDKTFETVCEQTINSTDFWSNLQNSTQDCQLQSRSVQSEYQMLFEYYKDIQAAALRTYITSQLSYMILHLHESGEFHNQSLVYQEHFRELNAQVRNVFNSKLQQANRDVWACDPLDYNAPGASYEITNFLQGYIDAEVNLNAEGSCALTCGDYQNTKHFACNSDTLCAGLKPENRAVIGCKGKVRGCHSLDDSISVCPAEGNNDGRYKYVTSSTGLRLGNVTSCTNELKAYSWVRWFVKCSNCFCFCDDSSNSDRYFSLREVVSDIEKNQIVTGVSLTKRNGIVQFVIAQRQLLAFGNVDRTPIEYGWNLAEQFVANSNESRDGVDYFTLTYENRNLNLDTIIAPPNTVVTGVRFNINKKRNLLLEVRFTEFDAFTGKLINLENSVWQSNADGGKSRINTDNLDVPTKTTRPSVPYFDVNKFVRFGPTHKSADLSQRTVPFIDGQKVEPKMPAPLAGIGLYYKSSGFIAPKIVLYNFEASIQ